MNMLSTTLQLTTSKMRKRLSKDDWTLPIVCLSLMIPLITSLYSLRATSIAWNYGVVTAKIPQLITYEKIDIPVSLNLASQNIAQSSKLQIGDKTVTIILNSDALYFGPLEAFSSKMSDVRNKFKLTHRDGSPQMGQMFKDLKQWSILNNVTLSNVAVLVPFPSAPMALITEMIGVLKSSGQFSEVVLGSGLQ
jgi:hypothetical protein